MTSTTAHYRMPCAVLWQHNVLLQGLVLSPNRLSFPVVSGVHLRYTVRLCATMLVAITRSTNLAATRQVFDLRLV